MLRRRRETPRRREAPQYDSEEWNAATFALWLRQAGRCWWCGSELREEGVRHHRKRRRDGGDSLANLVLLHGNCHNVAKGSVHQEPKRAQQRGFIVPTWADPRAFPVLVGADWWLLDDDGGKTWSLPRTQ